MSTPDRSIYVYSLWSVLPPLLRWVVFLSVQPVVLGRPSIRNENTRFPHAIYVIDVWIHHLFVRPI